MRRGLDTNVLVAAHIASADAHESAYGWLAGQMRDSTVVLVVSAIVLHEFVHIATDARRFQPALTMAEALAIAEIYVGRSNIECVSVTESAWRRAASLLRDRRLGRNRIADALLAATLLDHEVTELATCNPGDFQGIDGLKIVNPCATR